MAVILLSAESVASADAWDRLDQRLDALAARAKDTPDAEIDAAIEEVMAHVRPRKR